MAKVTVDELVSLYTWKEKGNGVARSKKELASLRRAAEQALDAVAQLDTELADIGKTARKTGEGVKKASDAAADGLDKMGDAARKAGDGTRKAGSAARGSARDIDKLKGKVKAATSQLNNMRRAMLEAFVARGIVDGMSATAAGVVKTTSAFQTLNARLLSLTGTQAGATKQMIRMKEMAVAMPFTIQEITDSFIRLEVQGIRATDSFMTSLGDMAAANGKTLADAAEAVKDAVVGEFERLKEFGIRGSKQGDVLFLNGRKVKNNAAEIQAALQQIFDDRAAGSMRRRMNTIEGAWSNFQDTVQGLEVRIGEKGLGKALTRALQRFTGMGDELGHIADVIGIALAPVVDDLAQGAMDLVEQFSKLEAEDVREWLDDVKDGAESVWKGLSQVFSVLKSVVDGVGGAGNAFKLLAGVWAGMRIASLVAGIVQVTQAVRAMGIAASVAGGPWIKLAGAIAGVAAVAAAGGLEIGQGGEFQVADRTRQNRRARAKVQDDLNRGLISKDDAAGAFAAMDLEDSLQDRINIQRSFRDAAKSDREKLERKNAISALESQLMAARKDNQRFKDRAADNAAKESRRRESSARESGVFAARAESGFAIPSELKGKQREKFELSIRRRLGDAEIHKLHGDARQKAIREATVRAIGDAKSGGGRGKKGQLTGFAKEVQDAINKQAEAFAAVQRQRAIDAGLAQAEVTAIYKEQLRLKKEELKIAAQAGDWAKLGMQSVGSASKQVLEAKAQFVSRHMDAFVSGQLAARHGGILTPEGAEAERRAELAERQRLQGEADHLADTGQLGALGLDPGHQQALALAPDLEGQITAPVTSIVINQTDIDVQPSPITIEGGDPDALVEGFAGRVEDALAEAVNRTLSTHNQPRVR
ncbi:MAG: hypothetical protein B7733_05870 [Myxococcales bacterium FL481]|nr:MAG: hypothetical protein B7733_05870 [Myxococcales bacterium FL481]